MEIWNTKSNQIKKSKKIEKTSEPIKKTTKGAKKKRVRKAKANLEDFL